MLQLGELKLNVKFVATEQMTDHQKQGRGSVSARGDRDPAWQVLYVGLAAMVRSVMGGE